MYLSILILPFLGSFISGFLGRKIGITGAHFITCTCLILSSILTTIAFYEVGICGSPVIINLGSWVDSENMFISWEFLFDQLTVSFMVLLLELEIDAVLVKAQLYKLYINKLYIFKYLKGGWSVHMIFQNIFMKVISKFKFLFKNFTGLGVYNNKLLDLSRKVKFSPNYLLLKKLSQKMNYSTFNQDNKENLDFLNWFVGFSDAEANFFINPLLKKDKFTIYIFSFMFKITLHRDDEMVLRYINSKLGIGGVRFYKNECIFNVTDQQIKKVLFY